jgi:RNA polymerase sigma factor (sigma-70 family)
MDDNDWLAERFNESRSHLKAVAYRMLGSASEAEDALQETWLKLSRADTREVGNLGGWLTTVVARVCLDILRTRRSRREEPLSDRVDAPGGLGGASGPGGLSEAGGDDPEEDVALADATGQALLVVLETLAPAERVAFVLHDMFDLAFDEIAPIVDRTPAATRQLASRARRRVRGAETPAGDLARRREVVSAFLAASRDGDFERLLAVLSPDVVLRADELAVRMAAANRARGAPLLMREVHGASSVANTFKGRARGALRAIIDGEAGAVWAPGGHVRAAFVFTLRREKISSIELITEPEDLAGLDIKID